MIQGVGIDITDISRIERIITQYKSTFLKKVFTPLEIEYCEKMAHSAVHYAGRWAAKEAFYKAIPLSCQEVSSWKSIEIKASDRGKPEICVCSDALQRRLDNEGITAFHVSISHEKKYCIAQVISENR